MNVWTAGILVIGAWPLAAQGARSGFSSQADPPKTMGRYEFSQTHMGTRFEMVLFSADKSQAQRASDAAFRRIAALDRALSDYKNESELNRLSRHTDKGPMPAAVAVSDDLWNVLKLSQQISHRSHGAFDITVGPLTKLWRRARRRGELPNESRLKAALQSVGYQAVKLDPKGRRVKLQRAKMRLDLGGIAKGYAAQQALKKLAEHEVSRALVNAGGDMALGESPPGEKGWKIGAAPLKPKGRSRFTLSLSNYGVATSGDAWQFVEIGGRRYSHIIDPKTGLGLTRRSGVTVIAPDAAIADALASSLSVMAPADGMKLIESTPGAAAIIVELQDGRIHVHRSKRVDDFEG